MAIFRRLIPGVAVLALAACTGATATSLPAVTLAPTHSPQPVPPTQTESPPAILPSVTAHTFEPTPTAWPTLVPNSRTGIPMVDAVIEAVLATDANKVLSLIHYSTLGCTHESGLGGPPRCKDNEPEGMLVEAFPVLGSEGSFVRKEGMQFTFPPKGYGLFAVYQVIAGGFIPDYGPEGDYGIIFVTDMPDWVFTALVDETGMVRARYTPTLESAFNRGVGEFILPPVTMPDLHPVISENQTWVQLDKPNVILAFPNTITLVENLETNRRGSFASYDFLYQTGANTPRFQEIQFFSAESIEAFTDTCQASSTPCFFGDYPDLEFYDTQRASFEAGAGLEDFVRWNVYHRDYFVRNIPCEGDSCVIREYTMFLGDVKVDIWMVMASADEADQADELFTSLQMIE